MKFKGLQSSLSTYVTLIFVTIAVLITLAYIFIYSSNLIKQSRIDAEEDTRNELNALRASISDDFSTWAERIKITAIGITSNLNHQPLHEEERKEIETMLTRVVESQTSFYLMYCFSNVRWNAKNGFFAMTGKGYVPPEDFDNTKRSWFIAAKNAKGRVVFADPIIDIINNNLITTVSTDILNDQEESLGILSGNILISSLNELVKRGLKFEGQVIHLINRHGYFITNDNAEKVLKADFFEEYGLDNYRNKILFSNTYFNIDKKNLIYATHIINPGNKDGEKQLVDWVLVTTIPAATFSILHNSLLPKMIIIGLAIILITGVLVWYLTRRLLVKPIKEAEAIAEALAAENFLIDIHVNRIDEIGSMQRAFIKIRNNLNGTIQALNSDLILSKEKAEAERDKADNANKAKSSFLASMSHEIRTPMNAIIGMSELIRTDNFDKTQKHYFADIRKMAQALLQIINDILDFSKIEAGKMELVPVHYNLLDLYDNICSLTKFTASSKSLVFTHTFVDALPTVLYGDEVRVRQIVTNIVNNAVKYTREGSVSLRFEYLKKDKEEFFVCIVKDTGLGIKKEDMSKIFLAFEQADMKKNRGITGTGLGLAITSKFVELMNGTISVESEYGKGSVFTVVLPLVCGDSSLVKKESKINFVVTPDVSILVVDDVALNLTVALGFLSLHHITADTALSGYEAIEKIKEKSYNIIFMDHMMPEIDGVETTRFIRDMYKPADSSTERFKDVPIVALTANAIAGMRDFFLQSGMNDFISKPIEQSKLSEVIIRFLPEDKIHYLANTSEEDIIDKKNNALIEEIAGIKNLDIEKGLAYLRHNTRIYLEMLKEFCAEYKSYVNTIQKMCEDKTWTSYAIKIHAIKGICAGLSSEPLRAWAFKLEQAARSENPALCAMETAGFCEMLCELGDNISATSLCKRDIHSNQITIDTGNLVNKLRMLIAHCDGALRGETGAGTNAEKLSLELTRYTHSIESDNAVIEITEFIKEFDYDQAIEKIETLIKTL